MSFGVIIALYFLRIFLIFSSFVCAREKSICNRATRCWKQFYRRHHHHHRRLPYNEKLFQIYREKEVFATLHGRSCTNWSNEAYGATLEISSDFWLPWNPMRTVEKIEKFDIEKKNSSALQLFSSSSSFIIICRQGWSFITLESIKITFIITGCLIKSLFFRQWLHAEIFTVSISPWGEMD